MTGYMVCCVLLLLGALAFWHSMRLWSVLIIGVNLTFASLLTIGLFQMLANILDGALPVMSYYNDMLVFLLLFALTYTILMVATASISKVDLHYGDKTEKISKWIFAILAPLLFSFSTGLVFFLTMPNKPVSIQSNAGLKVFNIVGKSLTPLIGGGSWSSETFVSAQEKRNAGVYEQTVADGAAGWKFDGDSPNAN